MHIVTIHANSISAKSMKSIEPATLHVSLPGHDNVPLTEEYNLPNLSKYLIDLLGDKEVIIIGNSIGGMLAHQIADKINLKALISIGIPPLNYELLEGAMLENETTELSNTADLSDEEILTLSENLSSTPEGVKTVYQAIKNADPKVREGLLPSFSAGDLRDEYEIFEKLDIPILFIKCSNDNIINNDRFDDLPFGEVVEIESGHLPSVDNPTALNTAIKNFLDKNIYNK